MGARREYEQRSLYVRWATYFENLKRTEQERPEVCWEKVFGDDRGRKLRNSQQREQATDRVPAAVDKMNIK